MSDGSLAVVVLWEGIQLRGEKGLHVRILQVAFPTTNSHSLSHSEILYAGGEPWLWSNELKYIWEAPKHEVCELCTKFSASVESGFILAMWHIFGLMI